MSKYPALSGRAIIDVLKKSGFVVKRQTGSHVFPESSDKPRHRERSVAISPFP